MYLQRVHQPLLELRDNDGDQTALRHVRPSALQVHLAPSHQIRDQLERHLKVRLLFQLLLDGLRDLRRVAHVLVLLL